MAKLSVCLTMFEGFYETAWSDGLDYQDELFIESETEEHPELEADWIAEALQDARNFRQFATATSELYVETVNDIAVEYGVGKLGLTFEMLESPREYNFTADKVFAFMPARVAKRLFKLSEKEGHRRLEATIKERFTSRDGFWSLYSNQLNVWLQKPVIDWDHNELGTLLHALLLDPKGDLGEGSIYRLDKFCEQVFWEASETSSGFSSEWDSAYDWDKYQRKLNELKQAEFCNGQ